MISNYDNFIGVYDDCISNEFCDNLINYFEWCQQNNNTYSRQDLEILKKDDSTNLNPGSVQEINYTYENLTGYIHEFNDCFWNVCYKEYLKKYSALEQYSNHTIFSYKVQKTIPTGGYHIWHSESGDIQHSRRIGVYILYLNDITDGGETEFLYFSKRISPKKGRLIIFPSNFPWTHRGNPPLTQTKYIMTGWVEFS